MSICESCEVREKLRAEQDAEITRLKGLLSKLFTFTEYMADIVNNHDMCEPEDEAAEGGVLAAVRETLGPSCTVCGWVGEGHADGCPADGASGTKEKR
jgi:hypothetical protein